MGSLTFPGLATGIDTNEIIKQLMAVESKKLARYKVNLETLTEQMTALQAIQDTANNLQSAADSLSDRDSLISYTATSSDSAVVGVSASDNAEAGSHTIMVNQLATSETWIQDNSSFAYTSSYVGAGTFIYSYNYQERAIATTSSTTLEEMVALINNDENNPGVTASLLYQGGTYHLVMTGTDTGEDYQITINNTSTEVWRADTTLTEDNENASLKTLLIDLDQWTGHLTGDESITISGTDHHGNAIEPQYTLDLSRATTLDNLIDEINSYFDGVAFAQLKNGKIVLTDMTTGASDMSINLTYNDPDGSSQLDLPMMSVASEGGSKTATLESMHPSTFVQTQKAQNSEIQVDGYVPTTTAEVQTLTTDAPATGGAFSLTYNGQTTADIAHDATGQEIEDALNALTGISDLGGVTVTGDMAGGTLQVTFSAEAGNVRPLIAHVENLTGTSEVTVSETVRGSNNPWITRNSNTVSDAISGITLNLYDVSKKDDITGEPIKVTTTISRDTEAVKEKLTAFVEAYNGLVNMLSEYTKYDSTTETMGVLSRNVAVSMIERQLKSILQSPVTGFTKDNPYQKVADIGLDFDAKGKLEFDSATFSTAIEDNYLSVINLLSAKASGGSDSEIIRFSTSSERYTEAGLYDVQVAVDDDGNITSAQIRQKGESTYRNMEINENMVAGQSAFNDDGVSLFPENGLFLEIDTSRAGTFNATVTIKEGIFTTLDKVTTAMTANDGTLDVSITTMENKLDKLDADITKENNRLDAREKALVQKYARLESTLSALQNRLKSVTSVLG